MRKKKKKNDTTGKWHASVPLHNAAFSCLTLLILPADILCRESCEEKERQQSYLTKSEQSNSWIHATYYIVNMKIAYICKEIFKTDNYFSPHILTKAIIGIEHNYSDQNDKLSVLILYDKLSKTKTEIISPSD